MTPELRGGQIWHQSDFPHHSHFLAFLSDDLWCLLTPPDRGGCIAKHDEKGHWLWNGSCLKKWLSDNGYQCHETYQDQYKRTMGHLCHAAPEGNSSQDKKGGE